METVLIGFFRLKPKISIKTTIMCSSINNIMGKTLITTQQDWGTTVGNRGFWVGESVTENTRQPRGAHWEYKVLGGEHR